MFRRVAHTVSTTRSTKPNWTIISYPFAGGQPKNGPQMAPSILLDMVARNHTTPTNSYAVAIPEMQQQSNASSDIQDHMKNGEVVAHWSKALFQLNSLAFNQSDGRRCLTIGGDHSMGIPTVAASLAKHPDLQVLWMDAHADINIPEESASKNVHGMPVSFLTGISRHPSYDFIQSSSKLLPFEKLHFIGIRDLDAFEHQKVDEQNIGVTSVQAFHDVKKTSDLGDYIEHDIKLNRDHPVHVSFDVDCLDPSFMHCTGTKVPDGLELNKVLRFLKFLGDNYNVVSVDITEVNFELGTSGEKEVANNTVHKLLSTVMHM